MEATRPSYTASSSYTWPWPAGVVGALTVLGNADCSKRGSIDRVDSYPTRITRTLRINGASENGRLRRPRAANWAGQALLPGPTFSATRRFSDSGARCSGRVGIAASDW